MKPLISLLFLVTVSCTSSDGFVREEVLECGPGQNLTIEAGLADPGRELFESASSRMTFVVRVSNNAHEEVTVTSIRVEDRTYQQRADVETVVQTSDQVIAGGDDHTFELPMTVRFLDQRSGSSSSSINSEAYFVVSVELLHGGVYRCSFVVPI